MELYNGMKFSSYEEFKNYLDDYCNLNNVQFWKREARTLKKSMRFIRRAVVADEKLVYYSMKLCCIFGGREHIKRRKLSCKKERQSKTFRQGCAAYIKLLLSRDAKYLEIVEGHLEHNHLISREIYESLPHQRKLSPDVIEKVRKYMQLKASKKLVQQEIIRETGKKVTLKDLSNIAQKFKRLSAANEFLSKSSAFTNEIEAAVSSMHVSNEVEVTSNETDPESSFGNTAKNDENMMETVEVFYHSKDTPKVPVTGQPIIVKIPTTPGRFSHSEISQSSTPVHISLSQTSQLPNPAEVSLSQPEPAEQKLYPLNTYSKTENTVRIPVVYVTQRYPPNPSKVPARHTSEPVQENTEQTPATNSSLISMKDSSTSTMENSFSNCKHDDCDPYGQYVASEIRAIGDAKQRNILKVKLQLLIFKAHQGLLTLDDIKSDSSL